MSKEFDNKIQKLQKMIDESLGFFFIKIMSVNASVPELILYFAEFYLKILPFFIVITYQTAFLILLGDNQISLAVGIGTSIEILEVRL